MTQADQLADLAVRCLSGVARCVDRPSVTLLVCADSLTPRWAVVLERIV